MLVDRRRCRQAAIRPAGAILAVEIPGPPPATGSQASRAIGAYGIFAKPGIALNARSIAGKSRLSSRSTA